MLKVGSVILSVWSAINMAIALGFVGTVLLGNNHPVLTQRISAEEMSSLSSTVVDTANSMAVFGNGTLVAFCLLTLFGIWNGVQRRVVWVFWALLGSMVVAMLAGFAGDYVSGTSYLIASIPSALILAAGFTCTALGLFRSRPDAR